MRIVLACLIIAFTAAPGLAQLPEPLAAALAMDPLQARPAGLDFRVAEGGQAITVRVDLSGLRPSYTLLQPDEGALNVAQRDMWEGFLDPEDDAFHDPENEDAGSRLTGPVDPRAMIGDEARHLRDEDGLAIYGFEPRSMSGALGDSAEGGDRFADAMLKHLTGEVAVDTDRGEIAWVHLFAQDSFKPNMAVRIDSFSMRQSFVFEPAYAAPRLARLDMALSGSAAFQAFEQSMAMEISNMVFENGDAQSSGLGEVIESP